MKIETEQCIHDLASRIHKQPDAFIFAAFSAPNDKNAEIKRVRMRPVLLKGTLYYQIASFTKTQSFTVNIAQTELQSELSKAFSRFTQGLIHFVNDEIHAHIEGTKTSCKVTEHKKVYLQSLTHNRPKNYQLPEKEPSELLIALGIQSKEGRVLRDKFDKFKQINRFLELVQSLDLTEKPTIIDFGCGKAYLTFALYSMLKEATVYGVDARKDVIDKCLALNNTLGHDTLHFSQMRIEQFTHDGPVDLVLALHACDTATDAALYKAIQLEAKNILVAPCCQHEVAKEIKKEAFPLMLSHGILKERYSALVTDALRAEILNQLGYSVDLVEFIDPEHTPKNLLIRATRKHNAPKPDWTAYQALKKSLGITLTLEKLVGL